MTEKVSTQSNIPALASVENIKFLATMLLHSIQHKPSDKMLRWVASEIINNAESAEQEISTFEA